MRDKAGTYSDVNVMSCMFHVHHSPVLVVTLLFNYYIYLHECLMEGFFSSLFAFCELVFPVIFHLLKLKQEMLFLSAEHAVFVPETRNYW